MAPTDFRRFINRTIPLLTEVHSADKPPFEREEHVVITSLEPHYRRANGIVVIPPANEPERTGLEVQVSFDLLSGYYHLVLPPEELPTPGELTNFNDFMLAQGDFMEALGIELPAKGEEYLGRLDFKAAIDGMVTEAAEVLDAVSTLTKPWKVKSVDEVRSHLLEESIDVLFMLLEVWVFAGLTAQDVATIYQLKLAKNYRRLQDATRADIARGSVA
jgi:NTP pyrophosphatase (non-canonical NTP hydrolase)